MPCVALAAAMAVPAFATLNPVGSLTSGEALFCSVATVTSQYCAERTRVDFQVTYNAGTQLYTYRYQIENFSNRFLGRFVIELPFIGAFNGGVGFVANADLDNAPYNHSVGGENEPSGTNMAPINPMFALQSSVEPKAEFSFPITNIPPNRESAVLYGISTRPPTRGFGFIQDTIQFNNQFSPAQFIPVPVPEPSTVLFIGSGLAALALRRRFTGK
jgi:hypothetical protein